jgi:acyl carrier protein
MTPMDKNIFYKRLDEMLEVAPGTIQGSVELAGLEAWDSLAVMSFIAMIDSQYQISLPAVAIIACRTVDDLATLVEEDQRV